MHPSPSDVGNYPFYAHVIPLIREEPSSEPTPIISRTSTKPANVNSRVCHLLNETVVTDLLVLSHPPKPRPPPSITIRPLPPRIPHRPIIITHRTAAHTWRRRRHPRPPPSPSPSPSHHREETTTTTNTTTPHPPPPPVTTTKRKRHPSLPRGRAVRGGGRGQKERGGEAGLAEAGLAEGGLAEGGLAEGGLAEAGLAEGDGCAVGCGCSAVGE
jgi:hypothetical protein